MKIFGTSNANRFEPYSFSMIRIYLRTFVAVEIVFSIRTKQVVPFCLQKKFKIIFGGRPSENLNLILKTPDR